MRDNPERRDQQQRGIKMAKRIQAVVDGKQLEFDGTPLYVQNMSLGGRTRVKQAQLQFGDRKIPAQLIAAAQSGDKEAVTAAMASADISMNDMIGAEERNAAALIAECIVDENGKRVFSSAAEVMEVEGDECDRYLIAIRLLDPTPVDPTKAEVKAIAGNSEATTSDNSGT